jgi:hypothetical protein
MNSSRQHNGTFSPCQPTTPAPAAAAAPPSTNGGNGRDGRGRFTAGNRGGPGNPFARQTAALRRAFLAVVTPEHIEAIARMLLERALGGDLAAVKLLLLYVIGRPAEAADPDTLDVQEWQLFQRMQASAEQVQGALGGLPVEVACQSVRAARGPIADAAATLIVQALNQDPAAPRPAAPEEAAPASADGIRREGPAEASADRRPQAARSSQAPPRRHSSRQAVATGAGPVRPPANGRRTGPPAQADPGRHLRAELVDESDEALAAEIDRLLRALPG